MPRTARLRHADRGYYPTNPVWIRVTYNGTTLTVRALDSDGAPNETAWSNATPCYTSTNFDFSGGMIGLAPAPGNGLPGHVTIKTDRDANGTYEETDLVDDFTLTSGGGKGDEYIIGCFA